MARDTQWLIPTLAFGAFFGAGLLVGKHFGSRQGNKNGKEDGTDLMKIIRRRRSIFPKKYCGEKVDRKVLEEMLEAARWAPSHHLTEPWKFIVFESEEKRIKLGEFLARDYKRSCDKSGRKVVEAKYQKKISNTEKSSFVVALVCDTGEKKNPVVEEICSVAMAVQNMHLVATVHGVGAYWSSGAVHEKSVEPTSSFPMVNPQPIRNFLELTDTQFCLGWMFVGSCDREKWPQGRRNALKEGIKLTWK